MREVEIRKMDETTEYFVSTCSHVNESDEIDAGTVTLGIETKGSLDGIIGGQK